MKTSILIIAVFLFSVFLGQIVLAIDVESPREIMLPKGLEKAELLISPLTIFLSFLVLSLALLVIFRKKVILLWAGIGGIYASIVHLIIFALNAGEAGVIFWFFPPFWPVLISSYFPTIIIAIIFSKSIKPETLEVLVQVINLILWLVIGALIGYLIKKKKINKSKNKSIKGFLIGAVIFPIIGYIMIYVISIFLNMLELSQYFMEIRNVSSFLYLLPGLIIVIFLVLGGLMGLWMYGQKWFWLYIIIGAILGAINIFLLFPFLVYGYLRHKKSIAGEKNEK